MKFIDPRIDFAFKKIFGSEDAKDILISFLESLMRLEGDRRIREVTILDPYLAPKIKNMKYSILDVKCVDHRGVHYIVEMQVRKVRAFLKRIQYNAAKAYVNQIAQAEDYPKLNQVIAVTITDFTLFENISHYVTHHQTREMTTGQHHLQEIIYYFIELSKFNVLLDDLNEVLDKWIYFIKEAGVLKDIPGRLNEGPFRHAFEKALVANMNPEEFELYEKAGMAIADTRGAIDLAREEGERIGEQRGVRKGRRGEAADMLLRQLTHKFGEPANEYKEKIANVDLHSLEKWSLRVLDAKSLGEVFK